MEQEMVFKSYHEGESRNNNKWRKVTLHDPTTLDNADFFLKDEVSLDKNQFKFKDKVIARVGMEVYNGTPRMALIGLKKAN